MSLMRRIRSVRRGFVGRERHDRPVLLAVSTAIFAVAGVFALVQMNNSVPIAFVGSLGLVCPSAAMALMCLFMRHIPLWVIKAYLLTWGLSLLLLDWHMRTMGFEEMWPHFVLIADFALLLRLGRRFAVGIIALLAVWVMATSVEGWLRFGLFDMPGTAATHLRLAEVRVCASPPCAIPAGDSLRGMASSLSVILIDFIATRGFAESSERDQAAMARTIETVEAIAQLLAGYDVDTVAGMLQEAEDEGRLPEAMHDALRCLEQNLRSYRPYLPAVLLEECATGESANLSGVPAVPAPGQSGRAAVVFTDICSSTPIWEAAPDAMKKAMHTHNAVMRAVLSECGGYEVKTIGDAFMMAFEGAAAGMRFGLAAHEALFHAEWPAALLEVGICIPTELWGGLTVRIGVNEGPVTLETNTLTGRVDYFGHTVNMAARLESACTPGAVAVPAELWEQVCHMCPGAVAGNAEPLSLKGVSQPVEVCNVLPAGLTGRSYHPLRERPLIARPSMHSVGSKVSKHSSSYHSAHSLRLNKRAACRATAAVISTAAEAHQLQTLDSWLDTAVPLLEQSGGAVLSLLGETLF